MVDLILVHVILWSDGKIVLGKRCNTAYGNGMYALPGGKREAMESPAEAALREAEEELGVVIRKEDLQSEAITYFREGQHISFINFFFSCRAWDGHLHNREPDKMMNLDLFSPSNLPENTLPLIRDAIQMILKGKRYDERT